MASNSAQPESVKPGVDGEALALTEAHRGRNSDTGGGRLEVRCPSCHTPLDVAVDIQLTDLTCSSCGGHFSLVDKSKATHMAPSLSKMGRFELIERLGVGGFGTVWKARDKELDRTVAVKVPRQGDMTPEEQEKFFREARAAAQLRHPSIVSVHEVGRDGDSIYIVSDFVRGVTLGDWLSGQKLTSREAAELCAKIADALHHAHEKGVVHRDLKPANIIIDGDGQPHLMDFGLARREVGEVTVTMDGQILGTPAYMSPEQAKGEAHTADRRSDVYSLGVILFQLLTGELPFRGNAQMLVHQVINEEAPSPRKLNGNIPKDLETITLKCLEKDPARRYPSAKELADEFRRYLAGDPIHARSISRMARSWRWAKRRPTAAALLSLLIVVAVVSPVALVRERSLRREIAVQKNEADHQRVEADQQRLAAESRRKEGEAARESAEAVVSFLTGMLAKVSPEETQDKAIRDTLLKALIEPAAASVEEQFKGQPRVEAAVRAALSSTLNDLGRSDLALPHAERSLALRHRELGEDHRLTLQSLIIYAITLHSLGRFQEAEALEKQALEQYRKVLGEDHPDTINALNNYADTLNSLGRFQEAEPLLKQALEQYRKVLGEEHIPALNNYAITLDSLGRFQEAEPLRKQALEQCRKVLGEEHPDTISALNNYANTLLSLDRPQEAEPLYKQALEQCRKVFGEDHPDTMSSLNNYAGMLFSLGRFQEAEPLHKQALEQFRKLLGEQHPNTIISLRSYADTLNFLDRFQEAEPLYKQALEQFRKVLGEDHPDTISSLHNYAVGLHSLGRFQEAEPLHKQALHQRRKVLGEDHPETIQALTNYANTLHSLGRLQEAEPLHKQALDQRRKVLGEEHLDTIISLRAYAETLHSLGRLQEAEPLHKQVLEQFRKLLGEDHPDTIISLHTYAETLHSLDRFQEAEPLFKQALEQFRKLLGEDHPNTINSLQNYALTLYWLGRLQEAEPLFKQALEQYRKVQGEDHPDTISSLNDYAVTLELLGRLQEAEPLYKQALEQRRKVLGEDHPDTMKSLDNYAATLQSLGRLNDAVTLCVEGGKYVKAVTIAGLNEDLLRPIMESVRPQDDGVLPPSDQLFFAEIRLVAGDAQSAQTSIQAWMQRQESVPHYVHKSLAWSLLAQGKSADARQSFERALDARRQVDGTYALEDLDPDELTAAYFLDLVGEQQYLDRLNDAEYGCFAWFYVGQRREFEGKPEGAIEAYNRSLELGAHGAAHSVRSFARWRLRKLIEVGS